MGRPMQTVGSICRGLEEHSKTVGLVINAMKTEVIQSRTDLSYQQTEIQDIEVVNSFTYLGTE
jgi:hypothetical protein